MALRNIGVDSGLAVVAFFVQAGGFVVVAAGAFVAFGSLAVLVLGAGRGVLVNVIIDA
jgi:hypothetical protein